MFSPTLAFDDIDEIDSETSVAGSDVATLSDLDSPGVTRRKIIYVIGDVTNPNTDSRSRPQIVVKYD